jgi:protein-L-isoaspartate(D-aspartate) O-methyltransferase
MAEFDLDGIGMTSQRTRDRLVKRLRGRGIASELVLEVIGSVPRHIFIDEALAHRAYEDTALPIGRNQTISQPFIVALMTQALFNQPRAAVLEVGTGSGYQTAVIAALAQKVYTIERIAALIERAETRLRALKLRNVRVRNADGNLGWADQGPFDGIMVTAAARQVPAALYDQLAIGGRLVIPVGDESMQQLLIIDRDEEGFSEQSLECVRFVPLLRGTSD